MNINLLSEFSIYHKCKFTTNLDKIYIVSNKSIIEVKHTDFEEFDVFEKITNKRFEKKSFLELIFILSYLFNNQTEFSIPSQILTIKTVTNYSENLKAIIKILEETEYDYRIRFYNEKLINYSLLFLNGWIIFSDNSNLNLPLIMEKHNVKQYVA